MSEGAGCEWIVEAHGCNAAALASQDCLRALFERLVDALDLCPVRDPLWHQFPPTALGPGGITGLCLLAESHLACHTFPEHGSLCLNLFCCRERPEFDFAALLQRDFEAANVEVRRLARPYARAAIPAAAAVS